MRVAVIGAGPSGLVTLKYLLAAHDALKTDQPIEVRCFESESGCWKMLVSIGWWSLDGNLLMQEVFLDFGLVVRVKAQEWDGVEIRARGGWCCDLELTSKCKMQGTKYTTLIFQLALPRNG